MPQRANSGLLPSLKSHFHPRLTYLPGQWLQCSANGSNVCRVIRQILNPDPGSWQWGVKKIKLCTFVASPEGVAAFEQGARTIADRNLASPKSRNLATRKPET